ncbi:MAG: hypothetical protein DSZ30_00915 [Aquificaceae bacterium]|nr:MAG: hypothetical protein DSZ30_00915 [Aquificaceae bacterium]
MGKTYDIPLRKLLKDVPVNFLKLAFGKEFDGTRMRFLDVKLPKLFEREADLVFEYEGEIYHLEIQTKEDPKKGLRMLYYYALILENYGKVPHQVVLYVGDKPLRRMKGELKFPNLDFRYKIVDLNEVDCSILLNSPEPSDWILASLCRMEDESTTLREIIWRINNLPEKEKQTYLSMLLHLAGLRPKRLNILSKEVQNMPITIDLEKDPFYLKAKREDVIRLYKKLHLSMEEIANALEIPLEKVKAWLQEEGLLKGTTKSDKSTTPH